jgi:Protein of unknown function (DUF2934)
MSRQRTNTTSDSQGRQGRSLAVTSTPKQENREDARTVPYEDGNGDAANEIHTRIKELAYELYLQQGRRDGHDQQDWLEAERMTATQPTIAGKRVADRLSPSA